MSLTDSDSIEGQQKAAIFMLALNEQHAAMLFAKMDDDEIRELSQQMANLGVVTAKMVEVVFIDFASQIGTAGRTRFPWTQNWLNRSVQGGPEHADNFEKKVAVDGPVVNAGELGSRFARLCRHWDLASDGRWRASVRSFCGFCVTSRCNFCRASWA